MSIDEITDIFRLVIDEFNKDREPEKTAVIVEDVLSRMNLQNRVFEPSFDRAKVVKLRQVMLSAIKHAPYFSTPLLGEFHSSVLRYYEDETSATIRC